MVGLARPPFGLAPGQLCVSQFYVKCTCGRVDLDDVAVPQQSDRPADCRLRPDMADAEAAGCAREPAVGDQGNLAAHALPGQRRRGLQHLPHAGPATRPLVADDDNLTFPVGPPLDGLEGVLLAIEAACRPGEA